MLWDCCNTIREKAEARTFSSWAPAVNGPPVSTTVLEWRWQIDGAAAPLGAAYDLLPDILCFNCIISAFFWGPQLGTAM